jgi:AraC family transcriptional regulator
VHCKFAQKKQSEQERNRLNVHRACDRLGGAMDEAREVGARGATLPTGRGERLSATLVTGRLCGSRSGILRKWSSQNVEIFQPPLDHHLVVLHLNGPKRVRRIGEGSDTDWIDIPHGSLSIVPCGAQYRWCTVGPIDFAHLYVDPARLNHAIDADFDRDHSEVRLTGAFGVVDPLLSELIKNMLEEVVAGGPEHGVYFNRLYDLALAQLALRHTTMKSVRAHARHALAPKRLRQVLNYVEANMSEPIQLDDLALVAKLSRFHFGRAFQNAMGESPLAFVGRRRLETAKRMLKETDDAISVVARRCGFHSQSHFAANFRKFTGCAPTVYRALD